MNELIHLRQADRDIILDHLDRRVFRKTARIVAVMAYADFTIETDRGLMKGCAGDWAVTNHPDDDPSSDIWTISAERMAATYEELLDEDPAE